MYFMFSSLFVFFFQNIRTHYFPHLIILGLLILTTLYLHFFYLQKHGQVALPKLNYMYCYKFINIKRVTQWSMVKDFGHPRVGEL